MRRLLLAILLLPFVDLAAAQDLQPYHSPYRVEFRHPADELISDLLRTERGDRRMEASISHEHWYTRQTEARFGAWGPEPRHYPLPEGITRWSAERKRERVVATAMRFLGYGYQHHHIPDWDPPREWPWKTTCVGHNGKGVDCSNFTGFVYNQGFGAKLNTDVAKQAEERFAEGFDRTRIPVKRIELPSDFAARIKALRTGDLIFVKNKSGHISHVILWVGAIGKSPDGVPLIMDSHGEDVRDSNNAPIPCGIHLRPFRETSWYNRSASHALRLIEGD